MAEEPPIFAAIERDWHRLGRVFHRPESRTPQATQAPVPEGPPMSVVTDIQQDLADFATKAKTYSADAADWLENKLPGLASFLAKLASNPALEAIASAEHLPEVPGYFEDLASEVTKLDTYVGQMKAKVTAATPADPADPSAPDPSAQPAQ